MTASKGNKYSQKINMCGAETFPVDKLYYLPDKLYKTFQKSPKNSEYLTKCATYMS